MKRHFGIAKLVASSIALATMGIGCSLIIGGDVSDFQCSGTSSSVCPSGMLCNASGRCVAGEAGVDPLEASPDEDVVTDDVVEAGKDTSVPGPQDLGGKCRVDAECKSRLCGASNILTTPIVSTTGPICTSPCCKSVDCPNSFVCFNGGTGGGYCVPAALAQRSPPAAGGKNGGVTCLGNSECRSGLCTGTPKQCLDTCCVETDCSGTSTCRLKSVAAPGPAHDIWVCAPPETTGTGLPGDTCVDSTDCKSDNCIGFGSSRICRPPCSNSASCKTVAGFSAGHCLYNSNGSDFFKFCFVGTPTSGRSVAGVACNDDSTCQSDYCDAELKKCANVCAKDSDCGSNESCRPSAVNTPYLRCVPKP